MRSSHGDRIKEGKEKLEAARAQVCLEKAAVEGLEGELRTVADQCEAHKAEMRGGESAQSGGGCV